MSELPHPDTSYDGLIRWLSGELGRPAVEGEIAYLRVVMYCKKLREQGKAITRQEVRQVAHLKQVREDAEQEEKVRKRLEQELSDDLWLCAILSVYWNYELRQPAKNVKSSWQRTHPKPIVSKINAGRPIAFDVPLAKKHRALVAYLAAKLGAAELEPQLQLQFPSPPPSWGVDRPGYYDIKNIPGRTLLSTHMALANASTPERCLEIFNELVAIESEHDSGSLLYLLDVEGQQAIEGLAADHPEVLRHSPDTPPLDLASEKQAQTEDEIIALGKAVLSDDAALKPEPDEDVDEFLPS